MLLAGCDSFSNVCYGDFTVKTVLMQIWQLRGNADGSGGCRLLSQTLEYTRAFHLSVDTLLVGYNLEQDGTIVVCSGKEIIASNNETLIGKSTDDVEILRKIKEAAASDKLIHARGDTAALSLNYGLMEHGRDYYVYAYLPESDVFDSTIPSVMFPSSYT